MNRHVGNIGRIGVGMIRWADKLYLSDNIKQKKMIKLMKSIEKGHLTFEVYCITFASNPSNLFDIINANEIIFPYYSQKGLYVLGLATSREQAKLVVKDMLVEVYQATGDFKVRDYFAEKELHDISNG